MLTLTCNTCGSELAVPLTAGLAWLEHHVDGSHTFHPGRANGGES